MSSKPRQSAWIVTAIVMVLAGTWMQLRVLIASYRIGGHEWLQGDWLINLAAGPIRRGMFEQALLWISDHVALSPLVIVVLTQFVLIVALSGAIIVLLRLQGRGAMALTVFTPAIFVILGAIDPISGLRKEMFGLLALSILALPGGDRGRLVLSGAILGIGAIGHELHVLLFPAWCIAALLFTNLRHDRVAQAIAALVAIGCVIVSIYALSHIRVSETGPICDALMARGLPQRHICDGAIAWLGDPENGSTKVINALHRASYAGLVPLAWLLCAAPLWRLWRTSETARGSGWYIILAVLPIFLLYPVGLDWGRWLGIQISSSAILMLGLGLRGAMPERTSISAPEQAIWLALALLWGPMHSPDLTFHGFLWHLAH